MATENINENKLYFKGAYITKSPCRDCVRENNLPDCSKNCPRLSQVQAVLTGIRSFSNRISEHEAYSVLQ